MGTNKNNGSSLIEVMVALFVLAIGILGVLAMQSKSMQFNQSSYAYTQAVFMANSIAERIKMNPQRAEEYVVEAADLPNFDQPELCIGQGCTDEQAITGDLSRWFQSIQSLPGGQGEIELEPNPPAGRQVLKVTVSFDDERSELLDPNEQAPQQNVLPYRQEYVLAVEI